MHVKLITSETLCGAVSENDEEGFFFNGYAAGPLAGVPCPECRTHLQHILGCSLCLRHIQQTTDKILKKVIPKLSVEEADTDLVEILKRYQGSFDLESSHSSSQLYDKTESDRKKKSIPSIVKAMGDVIKLMDGLGVDSKALQTIQIDSITQHDPQSKKEEEEREMTTAKETTTVVDVDVVRFGEKIVIPEGLDIKAAIGALTRKAAEEDQDIQISHDFNLTPPEGAIAFLRTLTEMFGFVSPRETPGFFGPKPPTFVTIETSPDTTESVPWDRMSIPGIVGWLQPSINWVNDTPRFRLSGLVKGKNKAMVQKIADNIKKRTDSLYRGKAIFASFPLPGTTESIDDYFPKFMKLPNVSETDLIFSEEIQDLINTALFTPIEHSQACRDNGISLKRGILLEGPYGTGKTLTATVTARKCVANGWTFIYLKNVKELPQAINFAKVYAPAAIFAEDIDQVLSDPDHRDEEVNLILNSIDGIDSKGIEILTVLTTNNVEKITTAMLRPGRLDTVVPVRAPDAGAAIRLVKLFAGDQIAVDQDFTEVGTRLAGCIPAMIQEVVKRSKLGAVRRAASGGVLEITARDVEVSAMSMIAHMKLLAPKVPDTRSDRERAAEILGDKVGGALTEVLGALGAASPKPANGKGTQPIAAAQLPSTTS